MTDERVQVVWCDTIADWPSNLRPGAALLAMDATGVPAEELGSLAQRCLEGPLAVVVCWGPDCGRVHDIFEEMEVIGQIDGWRSPVPEDTVMSTWHADQPIEDAFDMLRMEIAALAPALPHVAVVVGDRGWLARAEAAFSA